MDSGLEVSVFAVHPRGGFAFAVWPWPVRIVTFSVVFPVDVGASTLLATSRTRRWRATGGAFWFRSFHNTQKAHLDCSRWAGAVSVLIKSNYALLLDAPELQLVFVQPKLTNHQLPSFDAQARQPSW